VVGYVTGKKNLQIPWGKLIQEPTKWINKRCYPKHFQWRDPSKIRIDETFKLVDHWRERINKGREPLIWVKTSALFRNVQGMSRQAQASRHIPPVEQETSEENYDLPPSSDEEDEDIGLEEGSHSGTNADAETGDESGEDEGDVACSGTGASKDSSEDVDASDAPNEPEDTCDRDESHGVQEQVVGSGSTSSNEDISQNPCEHCPC